MEDADNKNDRQATAGRLCELRNHHRYTQQECANALGISQSSYAEMESGRSRVRRRDLVTLAHLYGLTVEVAFPESAEAA